MGVVDLWTGLLVQAGLTVAAMVGLVVYRHRPHVEKKLLRLRMPERAAGEWGISFHAGFAVLLATMPEEAFDEALLSPLTVDRRPMLYPG